MAVYAGLRIATNRLALAIFLLYIGSLIAYIVTRFHDVYTYMDNPAHRGYSLFILSVELFGAFALLPYALANVRHVRPDMAHSAQDWAGFGCPDGNGYHVFILIPVYKEDWETVKRTLRHAHAARVPPGCTKHIILCDDGHDKKHFKDRQERVRCLVNDLFDIHRGTGACAKPAWFHNIHVSHREKKRFNGSEDLGKMPGNAKSLNLNHAIKFVIPHILAKMASLTLTVYRDQLPSTGLPGPGEWHTSPLPRNAPELTDELREKCVVVVLDADMAINIDNNEYSRWNTPPQAGDKLGFLPKVLKLLMANKDLHLVLTPQTFNNVAYSADVFNHINNQFWHYVLPGLAALGYVACTGTNMAFRYKQLMKVTAQCQKTAENQESSNYERQLQSPFPTTSVTEDYAMSLKYKKLGLTGTYLDEGLVSGEMPEGIDNIARQRGRWTEGHWQIFFSRRNPFFAIRQLGLIQAILYNYGTLAYLCSILTLWVFTMVPLLAIFGLFPVYVSQQFRVVGSLYLVSIFLVQNYVRSGDHMFGMWLAGMSNVLLSWTFIKAIARSLKHNVEFASTVYEEPKRHDVEQGASTASAPGPTMMMPELNPPTPATPSNNLVQTDKDKIVGHLVYFFILAVISIITMVAAVARAFGEKSIHSRLVLPFLWAAYNLVGPVLFVVAVFARKTAALSRATVTLAMIHTLLALLALVTLWFVNSPLTIDTQGSAQAR